MLKQTKKIKRKETHSKRKGDKRRASASSAKGKADQSLQDNRFSVIEAYKTIRTNLQFSFTKKQGNVVVVTSTFPKDGKSTVVANISVGFAQIGSKVLVIDADLRKPRLHQFFNVSQLPGLSNYLVGLSPLEEIIKTTEHENLHIIPAGVLPPNPAELVSAEGMGNLLARLKEEYDIILIDTPPANVVSDSLAMTQYSDGVVLVVRHGFTTHQDITKAIKNFEFVDAKILGIVLNAVDYSKMYSKRYAYSQYGGYKGYGKYGSYYSSYAPRSSSGRDSLEGEDSQ